MDSKDPKTSLKDMNSFICQWMFYQWQQFYFTDLNIIKPITNDTKLIEILTKTACLYSNEHLIKELLDNVQDSVHISITGNTILHLTCRSTVKPTEKARLVISYHPQLISKQNRNGLVPLHLAVVKNDYKLCEELIKSKGIDINVNSENNLTPLHIAAHFGLNEIVKVLLAHKDININAIDRNGDTPLHHAAGKGHLETYKLIVNDGRCNESKLNNQGRKAEEDLGHHLKHHVLNQSIEEFVAFAKSLNPLQITDQTGNNPLHLSCMGACDGFEKFKYLIHHDKALIKQRNRTRNLPIHSAASNEDIRFLEYLITSNLRIDVNARGDKDRTPLHIASGKGYASHVNALIHDLEININAKDCDGNSALHIASMKGYYDVVKILRRIPWCRTSLKNNRDQTALDVSPASVKIAIQVDSGTVSDLQKVLETDVLDCKVAYNNTLLHVCASSKSYSREKTQLITERYPSLLLKYNGNGYLPIHIASLENNVEVVEYLAEKGYLNELTLDKRSTLHIASYYGRKTTVVRLLMFEDILVNLEDNNADTAAHLSARNDHIEILDIIEKHPKYLHGKRNNKGETPYDICPIIQSLKMFCSTGSASNLYAMLKNIGQFLVKPLHTVLLPLVLESKVEKEEKLITIVNHCPEAAEHFYDTYGNNLFHLATFSRKTQLLGLLVDKLSYCTLINERDHSGYTAWDYATLNTDLEIIKVLESHPLFEQSSIGLAALTKVNHEHMDETTGPFGSALCLIKGELWLCHNDITIYNNELEKQRTIPGGEMGRIFSVRDLGNNVGVGARNGLFIIDYSGKTIKRINSDYVYDVQSHVDHLYCISGDHRLGNCVIQVYNIRTWQRIYHIQSPCQCTYEWRHTLHIATEYITLACRGTDTVYKMTHTGELLHSSSQGDDLGQFHRPYLCHNGSDAVLAADRLNGRLQLWIDDVWAPVKVEPMPRWPQDAVYAGGALFVLTRYQDKVLKYVPKL